MFTIFVLFPKVMPFPRARSCHSCSVASGSSSGGHHSKGAHASAGPAHPNNCDIKVWFNQHVANWEEEKGEDGDCDTDRSVQRKHNRFALNVC